MWLALVHWGIISCLPTFPPSDVRGGGSPCTIITGDVIRVYNFLCINACAVAVVVVLAQGLLVGSVDRFVDVVRIGDQFDAEVGRG